MNEYRKELHDFILDPESGMYLDAEKHGGVDTPGAAFLTSSGRIQQYYVTTWELFGHAAEFQNCIQNLAAVARQIRLKNWYGTIVTCTSPAKHFLEYLLPEVETPDAPLEGRYLGPYPYQDYHRWRLLDFSTKEVLILTDVINSAALVKNLIGVVKELGGKPVAILGVVRLLKTLRKTAEEDGVSRKASATEERSRIFKKALFEPIDTVRREDTEIPLYALAPVVIEDAPDIPVRKLIRIDPRTILPEEVFSSIQYTRIFHDPDALRHFETSGGIRFGIHEVEGACFTTGVHFQKLFETCGDEIWKKIKGYFGPKGDDASPPAVLATTLAKDDSYFYGFVRDRLAAVDDHRSTVFIPRVDSLGSDYSQYFLTPSSSQVRSESFVLLLAATKSLEKLTRLVSVLLEKGIKKLTIVSLLNRMGPRTEDFIGRIKTLLIGAGREEVSSFEFVSVYSLSDFDGDDLLRALQYVENLFVDFMGLTKDPGLRSLAEQEMRYFRSQLVFTHSFESAAPKRLSVPFHGTFDSVSNDARGAKLHTASTEEGRFFLLCSRATRLRDYKGLIDLLGVYTDRASLYRIITLLIADISYIRSAGKFADIKSKLVALMADCRSRRFEGELSLKAEELSAIAEIETYYMVALALLAYLDVNGQKTYEKAISDAIYIDWSKYPKNFLSYFGNPRVPWALAFLLHLTQAPFRPRKVPTIKFLVDLRDQLRKLVGDFKPKQKGEVSQVFHGINGLLSELGDHQQGEKHEVLRYLHAQLVRHRAQHHSVFKGLKRALRKLEAELIVVAPDGTTTMQVMKSLPPENRDLKRIVEEVIYAAGTLQGISAALRTFFQFHPTTENPPDIASINEKAKQISKGLLSIRDKWFLFSRQISGLNGDISNIEKQLTDPKRMIQQSLRSYIVPLKDALKRAEAEAGQHLPSKSVPKLMDQSKPKHKFVLVDPLTLHETLWNLLTNVRHSAKKPRKNDQASRVEIAWVPEYGVEPAYWEVVVKSWAAKPKFNEPSEKSTFMKHAAEIRQYGGKLSIAKEDSWIVARLRLIAREDPDRPKKEVIKTAKADGAQLE